MVLLGQVYGVWPCEEVCHWVRLWNHTASSCSHCFLFVFGKVSPPLPPLPAMPPAACCHVSLPQWRIISLQPKINSSFFYKLPEKWCFTAATERRLIQPLVVFFFLNYAKGLWIACLSYLHLILANMTPLHILNCIHKSMCFLSKKKSLQCFD